MVMYAKKYPRLSDGYLDRHTCEKDNRYSSGRHNPIERRDHDKSPSHYSSPRYVHKSSHGDRNKDRHEREHVTDDGGPDRKLPSKPRRLSKHAEDDLTCNSVDASNTCRSDSSELKYEKRDGTDTGSDDQDHKDEVLKTAVRISGVWSEHISSTGKRYYYNSETEVSQWEKPKEWTSETPKLVDGRRHDEDRKAEVKDDRQSFYTSNGSVVNRTISSSPSDSVQVNGDKPEVAACHALTTDRGSCTVEPKVRLQSTEHRSPAVTATPDLRSSRESQQGEDMEISPENSPKRLPLPSCSQETSSSLRNGHKKLAVPLTSQGLLSTPSSVDAAQPSTKPLGDKAAQTIDRNAMIGQALQTLQKLHEVIMSRQNLPAPQQSPRSTCSESPFLPCKSPQTAVWQTPMTPLIMPDDASRPSNESPRSDSGNGNRAARKDAAAAAISPAMIGSNTGMVQSALAQAASKLQAHTPQVLPSHLSNHFDERLLMHVNGWPAEHFEKQARRYAEEAHTLGSLHCTKVSVDLKKARSLVRIAEIQSTLQEHRILFLQHRLLELENAGAHFTTQ